MTFYLRNGINVPSKSNKQKTVFCWRLEVQGRKQQDPDPHPLVRGTDPRIQIRNKMSRTNNTDILTTKKHTVGGEIWRFTRQGRYQGSRSGSGIFLLNRYRLRFENFLVSDPDLDPLHNICSKKDTYNDKKNASTSNLGDKTYSKTRSGLWYLRYGSTYLKIKYRYR